MPKLKKPSGRPAERFSFPQTWEQIATKVSQTPKPENGWPGEAPTKRKPTKRRGK